LIKHEPQRQLSSRKFLGSHVTSIATASFLAMASHVLDIVGRAPELLSRQPESTLDKENEVENFDKT